MGPGARGAHGARRSPSTFAITKGQLKNALIELQRVGGSHPHGHALVTSCSEGWTWRAANFLFRRGRFRGPTAFDGSGPALPLASKSPPGRNDWLQGIVGILLGGVVHDRRALVTGTGLMLSVIHHRLRAFRHGTLPPLHRALRSAQTPA